MAKAQDTKTTEVKVKEDKATKRPTKSPKTPRTKVSKEVTQELEQLTNPTQESLNIEIKENEVKENNTKENEMESVKMENVKVMMNGEEVVESNEVEEVVETPQVEEVQEVVEEENESGILHRDEFAKLTFAEQVKLMKQYRKDFQVEQIKREMGHSTSSYYALMKRLGLHDQIARPLSQPRGSQKAQVKAQPQPKEITFDFIQNGVKFEGDLNLETLLEKLEGFIKFGGGNESDFEFKFELIRK